MTVASAEVTPTPPSYLEQVEQVVSVRFLFDAQQRATAYTHPEIPDAGIVATYAATYVAGLRLLVAARRQYGKLPYQLSWEQRRDLRNDHHDEITAIQEHLSAAAPLIKNHLKIQ